MGVITKLNCQQKNKKRVNIFIDNEFNNVLFDEVVIKHCLRVNDKISESELNSLIEESQREFAKQDLFNTLSKTIKTEKELRKKLYDKGYYKSAVDYAIELAKKYKYIDDSQYVNCYISTYKNNKSKKMIEFNLKKKGIEVENNESLDELDDESDLLVANKLLDKFLRTKAIDENTLKYKDIQKIKRQLYQKGFRYNTIDEVTRNIEVVYEDKKF